MLNRSNFGICRESLRNGSDGFEMLESGTAVVGPNGPLGTTLQVSGKGSGPCWYLNALLGIPPLLAFR